MKKDFINSAFIILIFVIVGLSIMSYDEGIIVLDSFFKYNWQIIISTILSLFVLLSIVRPKGYLNKEIEIKKLNPLFTGLSLVFVTFLFFKYFSENALPLHLHRIFNKEIATKEVEVERINIVFTKGEILKNKCKYKTIRIKNYKGEICGVSKEVIDYLYEGDKLLLVGEESFFGFIPFSVKKKQKQ